ncbi:MAG: prepilin-type N-terminal cleavage/methylation domain-containing protein [Sterolibacterium sp.]|jgi:MSHA biogenesis protein MshO|nr:prepilin-type N-terminal cleavage/methylation domain-containing protein [Sterolibacterium sp.]
MKTKHAPQQPHALARHGLHGFTLVELVIVIVILGVVSATVATFVAPTIQGYVDTERRAEMTDAADTTLRRIARDVRAALPNSLRGPNPASNACLEFIPVIGGGRYRAVTSNTGTGDILDFSAADSSFNYLAGSVPTSAGNRVVIWNMGSHGPVSPSANAYQGDNTATIASATASTVSLSAAKLFPYESSDRRFFVIPASSTVYSCTGGANGQLIRTTRALSATPMASCPSSGTVIVDHVNCSNSHFSFSASSLSDFGLLSMTLVIADQTSGENVQLYDEVSVTNAP